MISTDTWQGKTKISKVSYNLSLFFIRNFGVIPAYIIGLVLVPFFWYCITEKQKTLTDILKEISSLVR